MVTQDHIAQREIFKSIIFISNVYHLIAMGVYYHVLTHILSNNVQQSHRAMKIRARPSYLSAFSMKFIKFATMLYSKKVSRRTI